MNGLPWHALGLHAFGFFLRLLLEEVVQNWSKLLEVVIRYREPARCANLMNVYNDDRPGTGYAVDVVLGNELVKAWRAVLVHTPCTKHPQDPWRSIEGIEHDRDAVVAGLVQMRDGLVPAAREFLVPECSAVKYAEVLSALGRYVDMTFTGKRCGRYPEHLLFEDPFYQGLVILLACCLDPYCFLRAHFWNLFEERAHAAVSMV